MAKCRKKHNETNVKEPKKAIKVNTQVIYEDKPQLNL